MNSPAGVLRSRVLRGMLLVPSASGRALPAGCAGRAPVPGPSRSLNTLGNSLAPATMGLAPAPAVRRAAAAGRGPRRLPIARVSSGTKTLTKERVAVTDEGEDAPWLIVGLGNPGPQYENTRHNAGFMVIDALAEEFGVDMRKLQKSAAVGRVTIAGKKVLLAKPMTFMNNSGESVGKLAKYYGIPASQVVVVFDDMDTAHAAVKLKQKGGHGGHNGMRSIISHLGNTQEFPRIKVGIGRPSNGVPIVKYVLQRFSKSEAEEMRDGIAGASNVVKSIMGLGMQKALSGVRL